MKYKRADLAIWIRTKESVDMVVLDRTQRVVREYIRSRSFPLQVQGRDGAKHVIYREAHDAVR